MVNQTNTPFNHVLVVLFTIGLQITHHFCQMWSSLAAINFSSPKAPTQKLPHYM